MAAVSIVGRKRDHNEDSFGFGTIGGPLVAVSGTTASLAATPPGILLVVCDGIGGKNAGEVASALAVPTLAECVGQAGFTQASLLTAIRNTDAVVRAKATEAPELRGMGATLTCVWIQEGRAIWGQTGDSRGYRWRPRSGTRGARSTEAILKEEGIGGKQRFSVKPRSGDGLPTATRDPQAPEGGPLFHFTPEHTPVARLVRAGTLTPAQARMHRHRHVIDQALGSGPESFAPEAGELEVQPGDVLLLCSDGLTDGLDDAALAKLLERDGHKPPAQLAQTLVDAANTASGRDNITAIVLRVGEPVPAAPPHSMFGWLKRWIRR